VYQKNINSQMVRLKVCSWFIFILACSKFQFQNGSINRLTRCSVHLVTWSFNSKMVRLIERQFTFYEEWFSRFNSKMVRLIANGQEFVPVLLRSFNSKMVRLIAWEVRILEVCSLVSIPKWFD